MFNETVVHEVWTSNPARYWISVLNPDGSKVWSGSSVSTPYTMLAYYDISDSTYNYSYYTEADSGSLVTETKWRCFRIQEDKSWKFISKKWAWVTFNHLWDETTVKALTYN